MNIIEAMNTGKKVKRLVHAYWKWIENAQLHEFYQGGSKIYFPTATDILSNDWEVELVKEEIEKKELSWEEIECALNKTGNYLKLKRILGFGKGEGKS